MKTNWFKKILISGMISIFILLSTAGCFGKFAITRILYQFNDSVNIGSGLVSKFFKTIVMYVMFIIPIYGIGGFIDIVIFNLIEFWTDKNPIGFNEYNKRGEYARTFEQDGKKLSLTYSEFGSKLKIAFNEGALWHEYIVLKAEPGKFFIDNQGKLEEVKVSSETIKSKMILRSVVNGKVESAKVVDIKDYKELEIKYSDL